MMILGYVGIDLCGISISNEVGVKKEKPPENSEGSPKRNAE